MENKSGRNFSDETFRNIDWSGQNLSRAKFHRTALFDANLSEVDLTGAEFSHAVLPHANLSKATLVDVNFDHTTIVYADMRETDLRKSRFVKVEMSYVKLQGANLCGADFTQSIYLKKARIQGARFDDTTRWPKGFNPIKYGAVHVVKLDTVDTLIVNVAQLVTCTGQSTPKRGQAMRDVGIVEDGAIAIENGKIVAVGTTKDIKSHYDAKATIDASGKAVCPGFVDPHTHVVYGGNRIDEFEMRIQGKSYMDIMAAGGGIISTMRATRSLSVDELAQQAAERIRQMVQFGTTTIEVKSGYGLDTASELKLMQAIEQLAKIQPATIVPTFMGAHAIPPEYKNRPDDYTQLVINNMIPQVADWYSQSSFKTQEIPLFIDVFCEENAFSVAQSRQILESGKAYGMQVKAHVDEFNSLSGVSLALELGATSIDHLDVTTSDDIAELAQSDTVGVVIPAVNFNLGSTHFANARAMIDAGCAIALTTDINPGSAPCPSMQFVMAIACRYQHLLPAESLIASTINAAHAVGLGDRVGSIEIGKQADILILDTPDYRHLAYDFGGNHIQTVLKDGQVIVQNQD